MSNHIYKNFASVKERAAWESAVQEVTQYMPRIVKDARANTSDVATRAYRLYFGAFDKSRWNIVVGTLSAIDLAISSGGVTFVRVMGSTECAATKPPYGAWTDQTPKNISDSAHNSQGSYEMSAGDNFYVATNSIDRTVKSAQFNTICHEFSHLVTANSNDPVYGNIKARALAISDPATAVACAENYGFYCEMLYLGMVAPGTV